MTSYILMSISTAQIRGIDYSVFLIIEILHLQHTYNPGDVVEAVSYKSFNAASASIGISSNGTTIGDATLNFVGTALHSHKTQVKLMLR